MKTTSTTLKIADNQSGHIEAGWVKTEFEPTESFMNENRLSGNENAIFARGDQYAVATINTWGCQEGAAHVFHKSHLD